MDRQWWDVHLDQVNKIFRGARFSINPLNRRYQVTKLSMTEFQTFGNSGAACISLAAQGGAKRIILIGYDCQKTDGKAHWHGDHPPSLGNAGQINKWAIKFQELHKSLQHLEIINCSRATALTCFPRKNLEDVLNETLTRP
jgi:hypothetical protein